MKEDQEKAKKEKEHILKKTYEMRVAKRNGFIKENVAHLNNIIFEYVKAAQSSLIDGRTLSECTCWWVNWTVSGTDILDSLENYIEGKYNIEFEECKEKSVRLTTVKVSKNLMKKRRDNFAKMWSYNFLIHIIFYLSITIILLFVVSYRKTMIAPKL